MNKCDVTIDTQNNVRFWSRGLYENTARMISRTYPVGPCITIGPVRIDKAYWERHGAKILMRVRWEANRNEDQRR
jgi:ribosomal protein L31E